VPEGGEEVVEKLLRDDVVLTGCSAGARRWWISGSTAKPSGGGARSSPALWGTTLGCKKMKLGGSMSCRESRWCSRSTGSESRGGVGG
jgi:hypothetical protein